MKDYVKVPMDIEKKSFEIIGREMGSHSFSENELSIVKRVIHTTADFKYKDILYIRHNAIDKALDLLSSGTMIYTDTNMALAGINKNALEKLNCSAECFVGRADVASAAKEKGITRSMAAVEMAARQGVEFFVFGNAPTALFTLKELTMKNIAHPKFIVGVPVGFVGAEDAKREIEELDIPMITVRGRKGGSNVAAAIVNALMYIITRR
ncbi:MAG: precorrin-8X methylmutase [Clostridium sp.]|jgi:precorrin-8X/cobalt-precorrin-8 methylmutase|uniref:precorrin-8X methylmutase n=1 Tax=Clostridium sp. TaxID=1506 RepID=UPI0025C6035E|nr:precorrin-8X methylmutase [Clostridium sp.]MCH3962925.1 precorrin-8X methylmutase [Clostridium sp.]MCI1715660.1 precorrin-8X methylmutase [Clostridium sp.]MCI1800136.1 precorrin-8X methylmutase [Clostridium sp.]MCI1814049.1 precorrin-8X methylmutase [Clostridium sp.]MCI1870947.1 precorrin-8X methylmutase [Clostridium sp.]